MSTTRWLETVGIAGKATQLQWRWNFEVYMETGVVTLNVILLTHYVLLMFRFLLVTMLMILQSIFLIKTSILVLTIAAGCLMRSRNIKNLTCWYPKVAVILGNVNILSFLLIDPLSLNFFKKKEKKSNCLNIFLFSRF